MLDVEEDRARDPNPQRRIAVLVRAFGKAAPLFQAKCFEGFPGGLQGVPVTAIPYGAVGQSSGRRRSWLDQSLGFLLLQFMDIELVGIDDPVEDASGVAKPDAAAGRFDYLGPGGAPAPRTRLTTMAAP